MYRRTITFSKSLKKTGVIDMGLKSLGPRGWGTLDKGVMPSVQTSIESERMRKRSDFIDKVG